MNIGIIGLGLMGASMGLAVRKYTEKMMIYGADMNKKHVDYCINHGIIDNILSAEKLVQQDVIFIAVPVRSILDVIEQIEPLINKEKTIITDMGSTKSEIVMMVKKKFPDIRFIGGHPMTGREMSGPAAALADLFQNKNYILTEKTDDHILINILETVGAHIVVMEAEKHDRLAAFTSHVPQFLATSVIQRLKNVEKNNPEVTQLIGQGFKDLTRIAASDPRMWQDIFVSNREQVITQIEELQEELDFFKKTIKHRDEDKIYEIIESGRKKRVELGEKNEA
ncbi:MAG: prephenate dehydrogenase [Halanaerobiaceae bacterium]